jgi:hypothetical protein
MVFVLESVRQSAEGLAWGKRCPEQRNGHEVNDLDELPPIAQILFRKRLDEDMWTTTSFGGRHSKTFTTMGTAVLMEIRNAISSPCKAPGSIAALISATTGGNNGEMYWFKMNHWITAMCEEFKMPKGCRAQMHLSEAITFVAWANTDFSHIIFDTLPKLNFTCSFMQERPNLAILTTNQLQQDFIVQYCARLGFKIAKFIDSEEEKRARFVNHPKSGAVTVDKLYYPFYWPAVADGKDGRRVRLGLGPPGIMAPLNVPPVHGLPHSLNATAMASAARVVEKAEEEEAAAKEVASAQLSVDFSRTVGDHKFHSSNDRAIMNDLVRTQIVYVPRMRWRKDAFTEHTRQMNARYVANEELILRAICTAIHHSAATTTTRTTTGKTNMSALAALELVVYSPTHGPHEYQTDRHAFSRARGVVSPHGGAEGNLIFAPPGTVVVELLDFDGGLGNVCFMGTVPSHPEPGYSPFMLLACRYRSCSYAWVSVRGRADNAVLTWGRHRPSDC